LLQAAVVEVLVVLIIMAAVVEVLADLELQQVLPFQQGLQLL
jgi:hypothetical protein